MTAPTTKLLDGTHPTWDLVSLGEVMLRLDPGDLRISNAHSFRVWEGGAEYNVARNLHTTFGRRTAIVTALVDNPLGHLLKGLIGQGGVDHRHILWREFDGIGRTARNGLNFTERGFGIRGAVSCSDRANTAASQISAGTFDWEYIFAVEGARWFHTGGVFAAISASTAEAAYEAMSAARQYGVLVSFDLNYRELLWRANGGPAGAREACHHMVGEADFLFGNEEDYTAALGYEVPGTASDWGRPQGDRYADALRVVLSEYPNLKGAAVTLRHAPTATRNDWSALCVSDGQAYSATSRQDLEVYDRVGGGDAFAAGFIEGVLAGGGYQDAVDIGAALGALCMTSPGDYTMATAREVRAAVTGSTVRISR